MSAQIGPAFRRHFAAALALGGVHFTAPWPGVQAIVHVFLVLGLAPEFPSPLTGMLWAAAGGWVLEGTLRVYPRLGGTPLANMIVVVLANWMLLQWPPHSKNNFWYRSAALVVLHYLLVNVVVRFAAGPHAWGFGWVWALLTIPLWASLALRLYDPIHRK